MKTPTKSETVTAILLNKHLQVSHMQNKNLYAKTNSLVDEVLY